MGTQLTALVCRAILVALLPSFLFGCATTPPSRFTSDNIAALHQGMSTRDVQALFGPPDSVRNTMCGKDEGRWQCEIWSYKREGERNPYITNAFWFSVRQGTLLNSWDVTRAPGR
jgi:hypothetical protein